MCAIKSMILLRDSVYCPANTDSHSDMLDALKINDNKPVANFIKVEITPPNGDMFAPADKWIYKVDQDNTPEWYVEDVDKARAMTALKEWADTHIFIGKNNIDIKLSDEHFYLKDCKEVKAYDNSIVTAYDNSIVTAYNFSIVTAYGNSIVIASNFSIVNAYDNSIVAAYNFSIVTAYDKSKITTYDNSTVTACDNSIVIASNFSIVTAYNNSIVTACGNSAVKAYGSSAVKAYNFSIVNAYDNSIVAAYNNSAVIASEFSAVNSKSIVLSDNSTFKDCQTKTIYQSGDWKLLLVGADKKI